MTDHHDHPEHRARVREAIQLDLWRWLRDRYVRGPRTFHESELIGHVIERHGCAHESVLRILRDLRSRRVCDVVNVSRGSREYEIRAVNTVACEPLSSGSEQLGLMFCAGKVAV